MPKPKTDFIRVKCECGNEQIIFSNPSSQVKCNTCGKPLAELRGGKAELKGKLVDVLK